MKLLTLTEHYNQVEETMTINIPDSQISQLSNENHALVCSVQPTIPCLIDKGLDTITNYPNAVNIISVGLAIAIICWILSKRISKIVVNIKLKQ